MAEVLLAAADDGGHDRDRGDRAEACFRRALEVVGRFTEGHDTADLRAAQTQLSLIHPPTGD